MGSDGADRAHFRRLGIVLGAGTHPVGPRLGAATATPGSTEISPYACDFDPGKVMAVAADDPANDDRPIDYRFTLANERTFLSWIRTALGLLAGGVAVQTLVQPFHHAGVRHVLAASCLALSVVVAVGAYVHWRDVRERMDAAQPLTGTAMVPLLSIGIALVVMLAAVAVFYR